MLYLLQCTQYNYLIAVENESIKPEIRGKSYEIEAHGYRHTIQVFGLPRQKVGIKSQITK